MEEIKALPIFLKEANKMIDLIQDDAQCGRVLRAILKLDDSGLQDPIEKVVYQAIIGASLRAVQTNKNRSNGQKGNQNARKNKIEEPSIQVSEDAKVEQTIMTKIAEYDSKLDFNVGYDEAYRHFSYVFNDLLEVSGGDETLVRNCYNRFVKNKQYVNR